MRKFIASILLSQLSLATVAPGAFGAAGSDAVPSDRGGPLSTTMTPAPPPATPPGSGAEVSTAADATVVPDDPDTQDAFCSRDPARIKDAANNLFWKRRFDPAKRLLEELLRTKGLAKKDRDRTYVNLSICDVQLDNLDNARKLATQARKLVAPGSLSEADAIEVEAFCHAKSGDFEKARLLYDQALQIEKNKLGEWNCDLASLYEGVGACYMLEKQWDKAKPYYIKNGQLDLLKYGSDDTHVGWSFLNLVMLMNHLNERELADAFYKKVFWNFRYQNELRILADTKEPSESFKETLRKQLYGFRNGYGDKVSGQGYLEKGIPADEFKAPKSRPKDFENWRRDRIGREEAPGLAYFDASVPLKGLILAIHGLGLSHNSYKSFADRIQHAGFGVIAFDVRGFGTYRSDLLHQRADFTEIINDFKHILLALRNDYPGLPIYILGESMGGAIALRVAAIAPDLVDGVVSSVPSGTRFHAKSTALEVAMKLLKNKNEQFDIGQKIFEQITNDQQLKESWKDDPSFRMKLSAAELVDFQNFMDDNLQYASKIEKLPVIIFQGYSDQLVKPLGTLALYQAIKSRDKDLLFVGHAEHLIFEEAQFDPEVVDGLSIWLSRHVDRLQTKKPAALSSSAESAAHP